MKHINFNSVDRVLSYDKFFNYKQLLLPEICFAGRSNVGKSSLINSLLNRKGLAKVSKKPGQTKKIIYYRIDQYFSLVDIPGYGYAGISKKKISEMSELLHAYFTNSKNLKLVYVLIDSRQGIKKIDLDFLSFLNQNKLSFKYLFTKSDKIKDIDRKNLLIAFQKKNLSGFPLIFTSSKTKEGIKELKGNILKIVSKNEKESK
ncbi:MAG: putative GTP-binding protein EngB [Alphaproteobacteria bacterium MarineAlpha9_Bin4]|nr:YihA family ribosome biogenesis GTP-binding protein [Pelagibacterales bacterium]PPR27253.1 MAG: putative GTP-binding protein EngB [Alphaproteobacteria bacterium MarineAlpha9_Bin4]